MLTIFTTPKPFRGHNGIIQTNAIQSWLLLQPKPEVILLGNDEGTAEVASRLGTRHVADVECNEYGTPLISSIFSIAQDIAKYPLMCYINADIILLSDFLRAIRQVKRQSYLIIGQRWDVDLSEPVDFDKPDWEAYLQDRITKEGKLHPPGGMDYFVFPRGLYGNIPPFAVGRPGWDNGMVYQARSLRIPVIDATKAITAIHQNHDYSHHPQGADGIWKGPERKRNIELMGGIDHSFGLEYITLFLTPQGLKRALTPRRLYFRMRAIPVLHPHFHFLLTLFKVFEKLVITVRWYVVRAKVG